MPLSFPQGEMNINSAVTWPAHGEIVEVTDPATQEITIRGFAYSGGGRRVVIVEVALDDKGEHWTPAEFIDHALDKPNGAGKFWTWRLWKFTVKLSRLAAAPAVHLRAWDASFNTQPADIAWNVLGMMNSTCWVCFCWLVGPGLRWHGSGGFGLVGHMCVSVDDIGSTS